ncbi:MAG: hypothetical protein QM296_00930 [Bacillota bacterium]|nr:hypothetical protein [Bacillota bacterium]
MKQRRKTLVVLLVLLTSLIVQIRPAMAGGGRVISPVNFPDDKFREYVSTFDTNNDGFLSFAELEAVTEIACYARNIASLKGIEYFSKLEVLICNNNKLQELDVSQNTELQQLRCGQNSLTTLDLRNNHKLWYIFCPYNPISHLDVSHLRDLTKLSCFHTHLSSLDLSQNTNLRELDCSHSRIGYLDLSKNTKLESACIEKQNYPTNFLSGWYGTEHRFDLFATVGPELFPNITDVRKSREEALPPSARYDSGTGILRIDPREKLNSVSYSYDVKSPAIPGLRLEVEVKLLYSDQTDPHLEVAVFRTGSRTDYRTGETVALAARAQGGKSPYRYMFYVIRNNGNGSFLTLRNYAYNNTFNWKPVTPDTYIVGVGVEDEEGNLVHQEKTVTVRAAATDPLKLAVFRTGNKTKYSPGETVALAARAEGGTAPYRYQFYVLRSNGARVILRNYSYNNTFSWKPVTPDTYKLGVNVRDGSGNVLNQEKQVTVANSLRVAVFRAGYRTDYMRGETVALAARGEGGRAPYQYQFYVYRSNGAKVILKNYSRVNCFNWIPQTGDTYRVCVAIRDAGGTAITKAVYVKVHPLLLKVPDYYRIA